MLDGDGYFGENVANSYDETEADMFRPEAVDPAVDMLAELAGDGPALELGIGVTIGDFATARVAGTFAVVYLVFNTINNLTTQDAQVACFRNAAAHLRPGGRFVVEVGVPDRRRARRALVHSVPLRVARRAGPDGPARGAAAARPVGGLVAGAVHGREPPARLGLGEERRLTSNDSGVRGQSRYAGPERMKWTTA